MIPAHKRIEDIGAPNCCKTRIVSMIATVVLAMVFGIVATAAIKIQTASAGLDTFDVAERARSPNVAVEPAPQPVSATVYVWGGRMTVGEQAIPETTRLGYVAGPDGLNSAGSLLNPRFSYGDVDYTIQALLSEQTADPEHRLVLKADKPLPAHLGLYIGDDRFLVDEAETSEFEGVSHAWTLDRDLGWTEGQIMYLALLEPTRHEFEDGLAGGSTS